MNSTCVSINFNRDISRFAPLHHCKVISLFADPNGDNTNSKPKDKLCVIDGDSKLLIATMDIVYAQAHGNYCALHLKNGKKYVMSKTLKKLSGLIPEQYFLRSHQSFIVNKNYVVRLNAKSMLEIIINDEAQLIPVSRRRKPAVQQKLRIFN